MKEEKPLVAVVILNWNGKKYLEQFLDKVVRYSSPHQVVLADNNSTDESVTYVRTNFPDVQIIVNTENGGFAKGYNDALSKVEAEYYILLNSDVEVTENWITPLLEVMQSDNSIAGCQPKIRSFHRKGYFEHAGAAGGFLDKDYFPFCRGRIFEAIEEDKGQYNDTIEIFWATGACLMIRADLYHSSGGLDNDFFAHMEEIDLCWRLKRLGYSFYAVGNSEVYHVGGGTLDYMNPKKTYLNFRNSLYMITKNYEGWLFPKIFRRLCLDGLAGIRFLLSGNLTHIGSLFMAHMHYYKALGKLLKKRKEIRSSIATPKALTCVYPKSILWQKFIKGVARFSDLEGWKK